ncbi:MAG: GNAT family N-acetyltransferase [Desulfovibrio sp.]|uniref:GNAT family N-acetyltransferase n=1 Tax=Desulfovibrio sp. TaxID=885 RepID=UPI001A665C06|nr:GNAT family N-acetyltransferase [Desulfovibrio sp.]MBD5418027.1 GNAT family N-acetyltransferase [Desulfovibrio sp.]
MELQVLTQPAGTTGIRAARAGDHPALVALWRRSVEASHAFLAPGDVDGIENEVRRGLKAVPELWLAEADGAPAGFLGCAGSHVDMLFVAPERFRRGVGSLLIAHARRLHGPLSLEVNEDNTGALAFYRARGFMVTGRSPADSEGRPYPLLHLSQAGA